MKRWLLWRKIVGGGVAAVADHDEVVEAERDQRLEAGGDLFGRADDAEAIDERVGEGGFVSGAAGGVGAHIVGGCEGLGDLAVFGREGGQDGGGHRGEAGVNAESAADQGTRGGISGWVTALT